EQAGDEVVLVDNRSHNGTFVNGRQIQRASLQSGATIKLGDYTLTIVLPDTAETRVEAALPYAETQFAAPPQPVETQLEPQRHRAASLRSDAETQLEPQRHRAPADVGANIGGLVLDEESNTFIAGAPRSLATPQRAPGFPPDIFNQAQVPIRELKRLS